MPSVKISLLALATAVAASPHYGGHSKYHSKVVKGAEDEKPYPTGGWSGFNSTSVVPQATGGGGGYGTPDKTIDVTTTSTTTILKTVTIKASAPASSGSAKKEEVPSGNTGEAPAGNGQCGPATITVTASEKVTVTVTPGGGAGVPQSSAGPIESKSEGEGYPVAPAPTPVPASKEEQKPTPAPVPSSKADEYKPSSAAQPPKVSSVVVVSSAVATPSATPSKTPSSGGSYSGSKRGLAYNDAALCSTFGSKFGFGYNWGQVEGNDIGTQFVPMMHRPSESTPEAWLANVDKACAKGTNVVMGFNEPDHAAQANLSPEAACSAWKSYMNPIASSHPDVTILGPSVTNAGQENMGLDWLSKFHDCCPEAVVHATNIHFYDIYEEATIDRFRNQVEKAADLYGKPVWVTEFGLNPGSASEAQAVEFLKAAMAYMDSSDKVHGYSWFMVGEGENQLNKGNGLSAVGQAYAS